MFTLLVRGRGPKTQKSLTKYLLGLVTFGPIVPLALAGLGALGADYLGLRVDLATTMIVGAVVCAVWYGAWPRLPLPSSRLQVRRETVRREPFGSFVYGALLGLGIFTVVSTPFVWVGLFTVVVAHSALYAVMFGCGFGIGRFAPVAVQYFLPAGDPTTVTRRNASNAGWPRIAGLVGAVVVAGLCVLIAG